MNFAPPEITQIQAAFPEIIFISFHRIGGFKAVYRAQTSHGIEAFKLLCLPPVAKDAIDGDAQDSNRREHLYRAMREVSLLGQITAPEVVKLGSVAARIETINGIEYLGYSEEWIEGDNLWELICDKARVAPSEAECRLLLASLIAAISAIWSLDNIHRDIKPLNVMRLHEGNRPFVLLDLGIAYDVSEPGLTYNTALIPATYRYLAPEMTEVKFRERLDFRSDLYTTGLTVYEYASGRHPIARNSDDMIRTITRALRDTPPPFTTARPDCSVEFGAIIDQLLRKRPMLRPGNLNLLQQRLNSLS